MSTAVSARTKVAGVAGAPITHSLSPLIHNAWLQASDVDGVYVAFEPTVESFPRFAVGMRGGVIRGLNITAPFKEAALALADWASDRARRAGSANLLVFEADGAIHADNTDGEGLLGAFQTQAPGFEVRGVPVVVLGAGGAARGAAAALLEAGCAELIFVNRSIDRARQLTNLFGRGTSAADARAATEVFSRAGALINATPLGVHGAAGPVVPFGALPADCVVMDMVYRPVRTRFLDEAASVGLRTVDGLAMLIGQAIPSFETLFGRRPPALDIRALAMRALEAGA